MSQATAEKETVVGPQTRISGEVRGEEDLLVRGRIDGRVRLTQTLTIDAGGIVQADVEVRNLVVSGVLVGSITASESVRLTEKARVVGDVTAPRFVMDAGAAYRGRVQMEEGAESGAGARRAAANRPASVSARPAPPRMVAAPAAVAASSAVRAPAAPTRVAAATARPSAPSLARPETAGAATLAPAWAKRKLRRR